MIREASHCIIIFLIFKLSTTCGGHLNKKIKLRDVETLTLHKYRWTNGRRSPSIPQLKCVGGSAGCGTYEPDSVQCYNRGRDGNDAQWECRAELHQGVKFGRIDVNCEGYDYPEDSYVLVDSCGVEYTLEFSNKKSHGHLFGNVENGWTALHFVWLLVIVGLMYFLYSNCLPSERGAPPQPGFRPELFDSTYYPSAPSSQGNFWTGMAAGGALGYLFGRNRYISCEVNFLSSLAYSSHQPTGFSEVHHRGNKEEEKETSYAFGRTTRR